MRPRTAGLALAIPVTLLTAGACGSQAPARFHPAGSAVTVSPQPQATPPGLDPFPGQLNLAFDPLPPDPRQAAVVTADRDFVLGYYYAIYTKGASRSYAAYIGQQNVQLSVAASIAQQVAAHRGYAGVATYSGTTVAAVPGYPGEQQVTYCVDESQLRHTDIRTGRVVPKGYPPDHQYYLESDLLAKSRQGAWQVVGTLVTYYPHGQARECHS
jgi:hypothetical protein